MTTADKIMDLSVIWKQAAFVFPYFHRCGLDWDGTYLEFLNRVTQSVTEREHGLLMMEFINLLGDGHTDISLNKSILDEAGYFPFELEYVDGHYYLDGKRVLGFNGRPMMDILQDAFRYVYHTENFVPRLGYILPLLLNSRENTIETEAGSHRFDMLRERSAIKYEQEAEFFEYSDILYIKIDDFLRNRTNQVRDKLLEAKPKAVILDIRENIGGMTMYGASLTQLFISGKFGGCKKWTRTMTGVDYASASQVLRMSEKELEKLLNGSNSKKETERSIQLSHMAYFKEYEDFWGEETVKAVFEGPLALLISRKTVSAAEDFTAFFKTAGRAVLIGSPTCGTSGTPLLQNLSCGTLRVCSVGYQLRDGTEFIGRGILPDIYAETSIEDLCKGRDVALEAALEHLTERFES